MTTTAWFAVLAFIAIALASVAMLQLRAARAALRVSEAKRHEHAGRERHLDAESRPAGDTAHDLAQLLTTITARADALIASLDPSGTDTQGASEIRRAALAASRLASPGRTRSSDRVSIEGGPAHDALEASDTPGSDTSVMAPVLAGPPVLVVEDEPGVRELIRRILVGAGREVLTVAGPHEALVALKREPAMALMLVDVVMPEMDGYDLAAEARRIAPGVRVVFMSAFARDAARHPIGDSFLPKPFTVGSLTRMVEDVLRPKAQNDRGAAA